jgi:hypothetical protein
MRVDSCKQSNKSVCSDDLTKNDVMRVPFWIISSAICPSSELV